MSPVKKAHLWSIWVMRRCPIGSFKSSWKRKQTVKGTACCKEGPEEKGAPLLVSGRGQRDIVLPDYLQLKFAFGNWMRNSSESEFSCKAQLKTGRELLGQVPSPATTDKHII